MKRVILILFLTLSGCVTVPSAPQVVQVPVATRCNSTLKIDQIEHPFDKATTTMSLHDQLELALADLSLTRAKNKELQAALTECTSEPTKPASK